MVDCLHVGGPLRPGGHDRGHLAMFAGGDAGSNAHTDIVDIYNAQTGQWSTASLALARSGLAGTAVGNLALFAGGMSGGRPDFPASDVVDVYNAETGLWSTTTLSQARYYLAATTVGNSAMFAGGGGGSVDGEPHRVVDIYTIPEPSTLVLLGMGGVAILVLLRGNLARGG